MFCTCRQAAAQQQPEVPPTGTGTGRCQGVSSTVQSNASMGSCLLSAVTPAFCRCRMPVPVPQARYVQRHAERVVDL